MGEVEQVGHGHKGVVQSLHRRDPLIGVQSEHLLQQVNELPPVRLLCQDVSSLQTGHVHLRQEHSIQPLALITSESSVNCHLSPITF